MKTARGSAHFAKRVWQTPAMFRNFPGVFRDLALADTRWAAKEITFRMRNGYTVVSPNADGARFPLYEVFADNGYQLDEMSKGIDPDATVLDIGGQIGCFALAVAKTMPRAKVVVYEASPISASYVSRNVTGNNLQDRITVHATALAAEVGTFTFVDSGTASGHNGLTAPEGLGSEVTVPSDTFDNAMKNAGGSVQIVKIDVEGAEYEILLNSDPASWTDVRKVVMEYHPVAGHSLKELLTFFSGLGFEETSHDPGTREGLGVMWLARTAK